MPDLRAGRTLLERFETVQDRVQWLDGVRATAAFQKARSQRTRWPQCCFGCERPVAGANSGADRTSVALRTARLSATPLAAALWCDRATHAPTGAGAHRDLGPRHGRRAMPTQSHLLQMQFILTCE